MLVTCDGYRCRWVGLYSLLLASRERRTVYRVKNKKIEIWVWVNVVYLDTVTLTLLNSNVNPGTVLSMEQKISKLDAFFFLSKSWMNISSQVISLLEIWKEVS